MPHLPGGRTVIYRLRHAALLVVGMVAACGGGGGGGNPPASAAPPANQPPPVIVSSGFTPCTPTAPPASLGLDPFYKKYCDANGIPIVSSELVPDRALEWARYVVLEMLKLRPDAAAALVQQRVRVAIMADTEVTTDIPEHRDLYQAFPGVDWDTRARGLGATAARPATSAAEENVLCYANDRYRSENILMHEFGHTIDEMGLRRSDPGWLTRLTVAYNAAMASGLWVNTYAATNREEYFAEGVQSWFDANLQSNPPNGIHNHVNTRAELAVYDPTLLQLLREAVPEISIPLCPP